MKKKYNGGEARCDISADKIRLYPLSNAPAQMHLYTKNPFFKDDLIYKVFDDRIEFTRPSLDYRGKTITSQILQNDVYRTCLTVSADGKIFDISEDSTEDLLIVNLV